MLHERVGQLGRPVVRECRCKTILGESGICDYAVNCYTGCAHGCRYCYARFMGRFHHPAQPWGSFVDAKVNCPEVLSRQLGLPGLLRRGSVFVSSVCDAYQPAELKYELTRRCLAMLLEADFDIHIQTKSDLVQRDFDLLAGHDNVSVCETITTMDEDLARQVEPCAPAPAARVAALRAAAQAGIPAKAFVGPVLPGITDTGESMQAVFAALARVGLEEVYVDRLNLRWGVWPALKTTLRQVAPGAMRRTQEVLFDSSVSDSYNRELRLTARGAAAAAGLQVPLNLLL